MARKRKKRLAPRTKAQRAYRKAVARGGKRMRPGGGGRFAALKKALGRVPGIRTPGALAAWIGRRKYGKKRFQKMAVAGRRRAARGRRGDGALGYSRLPGF